MTVADFQQEIFEHPERFVGFERFPEITERWIETHLMDMVNRGKPDQAVAAPRPLHGLTYRFRNPKRSRDYNAAQQLYEMLYNARTGGNAALDHLSTFFFQGYDLNVDQETPRRCAGRGDTGAAEPGRPGQTQRRSKTTGHRAKAILRFASAPPTCWPRTSSACSCTGTSIPAR